MQKKLRGLLLLCFDVISINISFLIAFMLRFDWHIPAKYLNVYLDNFVIISCLKIFLLIFFKMYRNLWRYASIDEATQIISAVLAANGTILSFFIFKGVVIPSSVYLIMTLLDITFLGGVRFSYRVTRTYFRAHFGLGLIKKRIMVVGAGTAGSIVIKEFKNHPELESNPVALIDDNNLKIGRRINGVPVLGVREDIPKIAVRRKIDEIIIAIPSASKAEIKKIVEECKKTKCKVRILPGIFELIEGKVSVKQLRDVDILDLLGREPIKLNNDEINVYLKGKTILVTGGGGSIGSELARQIAEFAPKEIILLDIYENNVYDVENELKKKFSFRNIGKGTKLNLTVIIASVRDKIRIDEVMKKHKPDVVFHAAAHKHVPLMESNPKEAVKNNVLGTLNVVQSAAKYGVKKFVLISTDKAVNPTNIMGATKRICEMIVQGFDRLSSTDFVAVRFGNVLGSNGSVIPIFKKQIEEGGPVTVTHPDITRYFMTIPEAAQLVIQAGAMAKGGEIFILDMDEPVKIIDLAVDLIKLSGFEPNVDIPIEFVGLRPGEKLYEELLMSEEGMKSTTHAKIFIGKPMEVNYPKLLKQIQELSIIINNCDDSDVKNYIREIVSTYRDPDEVNALKEVAASSV